MNKVYDTMMPKFRISVLDKYGENLDYVYIKDCKYFALKQLGKLLGNGPTKDASGHF